MNASFILNSLSDNMKAMETADLKLTFGNRRGELSLAQPVVMGILNITPDSFYDGGTLKTDRDLLRRAETMINEGAAILDMGAVSTRPGAADVNPADEQKRLLPAIALVAQNFPDMIISADTFRSAVARQAIQSGAHMINDVSGGVADDDMLKTITQLEAPYILMHMQGTPATMQQHPHYGHVVDEILAFFDNQIKKLGQLGRHNNIVLDPGFGFGKSIDHNYQILKALHRFTATGFPVMAGMSRKSMINKILHTQPADALNGSTALHAIALLNGACLLRVHDVKQAIEAVKLVQFYKNA